MTSSQSFALVDELAMAVMGLNLSDIALTERAFAFLTIEPEK
jgi:hypothetical protein